MAKFKVYYTIELNEVATHIFESNDFEVKLCSHNDEETYVKELAEFQPDAIMCRTEPITAKMMDTCKNLKVIGKQGAGLDNIDMDHAHAKDITVVYAPAGNANAVAEHAVMLMLMCAKRFTYVDRQFRSGNFLVRMGMEHTYELGGKTLGMIYPVLSFGNGVTDFDRITSANCLLLGKKMPCIAVDYLISENYYGTTVLYYNGSSFATAETTVRYGADTNYSRHVNGYTPKLSSQDIDGDGIIDIPATSPLPGYENLSFPEQICAVRWYKQNCSKIELTAYTFVDPQRNFMLTFPGRWVGMVTATVNTEDNSVTFWKYEGDIKENEYALLTIKTVLKSDTSAQSEPDTQSALRDGFRLFSDDSEKTIYYKSIMYEGLSLTDDEIEAAVKVRPEGYDNDAALLSSGN